MALVHGVSDLNTCVVQPARSQHNLQPSPAATPTKPTMPSQTVNSDNDVEWSVEDDDGVAGFINLADVTDNEDDQEDDSGASGDDAQADGAGDAAHDDDDDDDDDFVPPQTQSADQDDDVDDDASSVASGECVKKLDAVKNTFFKMPGFTKDHVPPLSAKKDWAQMDDGVVLEVEGEVRDPASTALPSKHAQLSYVRCDGSVTIAFNYGNGVFAVPSGKETQLRKFESAVHASLFGAANPGKAFKRSKESALHSLKRSGDTSSAQPERPLSADFEKTYNACAFMFSTAFARTALATKPRADRGGSAKKGPGATKPSAEKPAAKPDAAKGTPSSNKDSAIDNPPAVKKKLSKPKTPGRMLFAASPAKAKPAAKRKAADSSDDQKKPIKQEPADSPLVKKQKTAAKEKPPSTGKARRVATAFTVEYQGARFEFPPNATITMVSGTK